MPEEPAPFTLHVADEVLEDLHERLARARWPDEPPHGAAWEFGTDLTYLQELVAYWRDDFDWRRQEEQLNGFPQYTARVAGINLHFIHVPSSNPSAAPLLLSHGWPGSVWEFHKLIPMLTDQFSVVAPSLPGYGLSFEPGQTRFGAPAIADAFATLMRDVLGYPRFAAQGGDWGASVSAYLGYAHASDVVGIHLNLIPLSRDGAHLFPEGDAPDLVAYRAELANWLREETGYSTIQGTRPQTLAYALTDSPVGLAGWIVEKFRRWSDCGGDIESRFSKDDLLTNIMLYWATGAIGSSFWPYYARHHEGWVLPGERRVEVPTAYQSFPRDILHPPRSLAERAFNIQRWTVEQSGGHFAAMEEPAALARDVRAFFAELA